MAMVFFFFLPSVAQNSRGGGTDGRRGGLPRWVHQAGFSQRQAASGKVQEGDFGRGSGTVGRGAESGGEAPKKKKVQGRGKNL